MEWKMASGSAAAQAASSQGQAPEPKRCALHILLAPELQTTYDWETASDCAPPHASGQLLCPEGTTQVWIETGVNWFRQWNCDIAPWTPLLTPLCTEEEYASLADAVACAYRSGKKKTMDFCCSSCFPCCCDCGPRLVVRMEGAISGQVSRWSTSPDVKFGLSRSYSTGPFTVRSPHRVIRDPRYQAYDELGQVYCTAVAKEDGGEWKDSVAAGASPLQSLPAWPPTGLYIVLEVKAGADELRSKWPRSIAPVASPLAQAPPQVLGVLME